MRVHAVSPHLRRASIHVGLWAGLVAGWLMARQYEAFLLAVYGVPFGITDPVFLGVHALRRGLRQGEVSFPAPHSHRYHRAFDGHEERLFSRWEWRHFPLQDDDDP